MFLIALIFGRGRKKRQERERRQTIEEAVAELESHAGTQFDREAVRVMARLIREGAVQVGEQPRLGAPLVGEESQGVPSP
jgi:HD-GYP domain-containing protein (c-di-GMP phosphodiesterase class II)